MSFRMFRAMRALLWQLFLRQSSDTVGTTIYSPPAVYGENWGGNPPIFLEKVAREPHSNLILHLFALYFGKLHKGTPHYTRRGDNIWKDKLQKPLATSACDEARASHAAGGSFCVICLKSSKSQGNGPLGCSRLPPLEQSLLK